MVLRGAAEPEEFDEAPMPFQERREAERYTITFKLSVGANAREGAGSSVFPGEVLNISRAGVLVETTYPLVCSESITLAISTDQCPEDMRMPRAFVGGAVVTRVQSIGGGRYLVGLRFEESLVQGTEFIMFTEFLQSTALTNWLLAQ
jgi:hypothetical protein